MPYGPAAFNVAGGNGTYSAVTVRLEPGILMVVLARLVFAMPEPLHIAKDALVTVPGEVAEILTTALLVKVPLPVPFTTVKVKVEGVLTPETNGCG